MTTFGVTYRRDPGDDVWLVDIDGMDDVHTFGRNLDEAATNAREAIAVTADVPESAVELEERIDVADVDVDELSRLRDQALEAHEIYLARQRAAALRLTEAGVSRRDAARLLGVSHHGSSNSSPADVSGFQEGSGDLHCVVKPAGRLRGK